jgi:hypothetical protein
MFGIYFIVPVLRRVWQPFLPVPKPWKRGPMPVCAEIPWESAEKLGIVRAILQTLRECLFSPFMFFEKLSFTHNTAMSFAYALVIGSIGSILGFFWTYLFLSRYAEAVPWLAEFSTPGAGLILAPLLIAAKIFFISAYAQTFLFITGAKRQPIASTISIMCYAESTAVFNLIPVVGSIVAFVWSLFLLAAGLGRVHRLSTAKALAIILLPLPILALFGILAIAIVTVAGALSNGLL